MATMNINERVDFVINHNGIPFEVKRPAPNAETWAALDEYEEMKENSDKYKRYKSFDEIVDEVFADA